jgi:hypothetical protein
MIACPVYMAGTGYQRQDKVQSAGFTFTSYSKEAYFPDKGLAVHKPGLKPWAMLRRANASKRFLLFSW